MKASSILPADVAADVTGTSESLLADEALPEEKTAAHGVVTKAEFIDQLAGDDRIGSKEVASEAVDAVLAAITDTLSGGREVSFSGFGKFHVSERGPRQGVNHRTGERVTIPGGKVPHFSAGAALKSKVKR